MADARLPCPLLMTGSNPEVEPREPLGFPALVERVRRHYDDGCFACGRANPSGLVIDGFAADGGRVTARFAPRPLHRGTFGVLHGGLAATALDEIMVWAGIGLEGVLCVTASLEVRYRKPVTLDAEIGLEAQVEERSGRRLRCRGKLMVGEDLMVEGSGLYVVAHQVAALLGD